MGAYHVTLAWADGDHVFCIEPVGQLAELQEKCDAGPGWIIRRLIDGSFLRDDIRETIRLGLIGGGATPSAALKLVKTYVDARPLLENIQTAKIILMALLVGADEAPGKATAVKEDESQSAESSTSPPSTETPRPSELPQTLPTD